MGTWEQFADLVSANVKAAAVGALAGYVNEVETDGMAFLTQARTDLQTWTTQLAEGLITQADFTANVQADADLAELQALTDAGIAAAALQAFRDLLIQTVISAAFKVFVPVP